MKRFITILFALILCLNTFAQSETLTNTEIILMTKAGLSNDLISRKIKESVGDYNTSAKALIELKKAGVSDKIIKSMMDFESQKTKTSSDDASQKGYSDSDNQPNFNFPQNSVSNARSRIVLDKNEALQNAKTIAIKKSSLHPSRQALEKELLKRKDWKSLNLNIVRHKEDADLYIEIGYVSMSWITHRYVYRIFDNKSGTVIVAGETTSWGSLAKNLARGISKRLKKEFDKS